MHSRLPLLPAWSQRHGTQLLAVLLTIVCTHPVWSQNFVRLTDPANPIAVDQGANGYNGCSWIDFDNDGDLDLFANRDKLYRNEGNGQFTRVNDHGIGAGLVRGLGSGTSWADYDNDGDLDCFFSDARSVLYRNEGNGRFTAVTAGEIGKAFENRGWSCAWSDYDNDGWVDLVITHPANFVGAPLTNHLFRNQGAGIFSRITGSEVTTGQAPYTVAIWSDYDDDGDSDLFIGSGPANGSIAPDFLYQNRLSETGTADLIRLNTGALAADARDGQNFNWIDYDNDRDLDAFVTNYRGNTNGFVNQLYRNDGGTFTKITSGAIVTDSDISLGNIWADFDNDGDLDCFVTNESGFPNRYYRNEGDGTFTRVTGLAILDKPANSNAAGASAGDYDDDGDLDLFIAGTGTAQALYRNDLANGNNWLQVVCAGTQSNRAAIGAKVQIKATVHGRSIWQRREISAQNAFNGHNSLRVHFGLAETTRVDSLIIIWPSGNVEFLTEVAANQILPVTEQVSAGTLRPAFNADVIEAVVPFTVQFTDLSLADPQAPVTSWAWDFNNDGASDSREPHPVWTFTAAGRYTVSLTVTNGVATKTITQPDLIRALQFGHANAGELANVTSAALAASWADFDADGDLDVFIANAQSQNNALFANLGNGSFARITAGAPVTDGGNSQSASWGDYDHDGDLDLYVVNFNQANALYQNQGGGTFEKITSGAIVTDRELSSSCSWVDIENDGDLDMFVANVGANNSLYVNAGGSFTKQTDGAPVNDRGFSQAVAWSDFDNDGDLDLFVANSRNENNFLYVNAGNGSFTRLTSGDLVNDQGESRGASWADYDNDGDFDLFVANGQQQANFLYQNQGNGAFVKITSGALVTEAASSQGSSWGDFDNDSDLDLFVTNTDRPSALYRNEGDGTFARLADNPFAADNNFATSASWVDYDRDGDLDLFVTVNNLNSLLYFNAGNDNHWLQVKLIGTTSNTTAIGAKIRAFATINGQAVLQTREISGQTGFGSQTGLVAHFGLGGATQVDSLQVFWPSGKRTRLHQLAANQFVTIDETGGLTRVEDNSADRPAAFALQQNYPNPFNPATTIGYQLRGSVKVNLSLYNLLGEKVATLVDQVQDAGSYRVAWEGRDANGRLLPAGVYFYRLTAGAEMQTKRLLLLK